MRLSQTEFAEAVRSAGEAMGLPNHCTKRLVQKWETGEHTTCRTDYLRVLQAVTGLSVRELGFLVPPVPLLRRNASPDPARPLSPAVDFAPAPTRPAADEPDWPGSEAAVGRAEGSDAESRAAETGAGSMPEFPGAAQREPDPHAVTGSAAGVTAASGNGAGEVAEPRNVAVRGRRHSGLPVGAVEQAANEMLEDSLGRLRYALEHPSTVDSRTADYVETATARLYDLEHHSPARLIAPTVERHLATVTALLTAARHEMVRKRLLAAAGRTTALAGWIAFDRGDIATANRFWDTALSAAETTHDASLYSSSFTYMSYAAARSGDPCGAWQLAHTAGRHAPEDRRASAWAVGLVAVHAAELGQHDAAITALERSLELGSGLPTAQPGDGTEPWVRQFDRARLLSCAARTCALLDDARACHFAAEAVASLGPARVKSRAVVLAEAALATALAGEFDLSLDYGSAAAVLARELEASLASDALYGAVPVLMPHSSSRAVRELLPQLTRLSRFPGRH